MNRYRMLRYHRRATTTTCHTYLQANLISGNQLGIQAVSLQSRAPNSRARLLQCIYAISATEKLGELREPACIDTWLVKGAPLSLRIIHFRPSFSRFTCNYGDRIAFRDIAKINFLLNAVLLVNDTGSIFLRHCADE